MLSLQFYLDLFWLTELEALIIWASKCSLWHIGLAWKHTMSWCHNKSKLNSDVIINIIHVQCRKLFPRMRLFTKSTDLFNNSAKCWFLLFYTSNTRINRVRTVGQHGKCLTGRVQIWIMHVYSIWCRLLRYLLNTYVWNMLLLLKVTPRLSRSDAVFMGESPKYYTGLSISPYVCFCHLLGQVGELNWSESLPQTVHWNSEMCSVFQMKVFFLIELHSKWTNQAQLSVCPCIYVIFYQIHRLIIQYLWLFVSIKCITDVYPLIVLFLFCI